MVEIVAMLEKKYGIQVYFLAFKSLSKEEKTKRIEMYPLGLGKPKNTTNVCSFMLFNATRCITGTNLIVGGGYSAK